MSSTVRRFSVDALPELCAWLQIEEPQIRPLLEWLAPPPNLQQFRAVVSNLLAVLQAAKEVPFVHPPESLILLVQLIEERMHLHAEERPRTLGHLLPREQVRPSGMIGEYPIYSSLLGVVDFPEECAGLYRALHAVALHCGIGYRQQTESGIIDAMSEALDLGMRDIRRLESPGRRPVIPPPHPSDALDLEDFLDRLRSWTHEERDEGSIWGDGLVSLISAYLNRRARAENRASAGHEIRQTIEIIDEGEPGEDGAHPSNRDVSQAIKVNRLKEVPSRHQQATLQQQGLHPDEVVGTEAIRFEGPGTHHPLRSADHRQNLRQTRGLKNRIIRTAQHLPSEWATPTPFELGSLLSVLAREISSANEAAASVSYTHLTLPTKRIV